MGVTQLQVRSTRLAGPSIRVALVGREEAGAENLSLRYLAAALAEAGHEPVIVPLSGPSSLPRAAARILALAPPLVGLSMPDSDATIDALAFARYLRAQGYSGHVTCGGPVATLVRHELLDAHAALDSVVRHDGEVPVRELANRIAQHRDVEDVPGLSTRSGDGAPSPVADPTPIRIRPLHANPLPRLIGIPMARLSASRGCPGRCPYCTPAALQREAVAEGRTAGLSREELADAGVGKTRYRHYVDVADEVADLYHGQGARFFQLVDENVLSGEPGRAEEWLEGLMRELGGRGVGRTAWCLQADPETLTPRVLDLLQALGVVRVSVGIEGLTSTQLRSLGRGASAADNLALLGKLSRRGFVTSFNSIVVHNHSTPETIASELDALASIHDVHYDVLSMAVYPGTQAYKTLLREGRVTGGMLAMRFEPRDVIVNRFRAALIRIRLQALGRYGTNIFANDVAINLALARRFEHASYSPSLEAELSRAARDLNTARHRAYRAALALSHSELAPEARERSMAALLETLQRDLVSPRERLERIQRTLQGSPREGASSGGLMIGSALAASFVLVLAATGCGGQVSSQESQAGGDVNGSGATATSGSGGVSDPGASGGTPSMGGAGGTFATGGTGGTFATGGTGGTVTTGAGGTSVIGGTGGAMAGAGGQMGTGGSAPLCDPTATGAAQSAVSSALHQSACACNPETFEIVIDPYGHAVNVLTASGAPAEDAVRVCYLQALAGQTFPCLSGEQVWYECVITLI